jgi:hypothetical protein
LILNSKVILDPTATSDNSNLPLSPKLLISYPLRRKNQIKEVTVDRKVASLTEEPGQEKTSAQKYIQPKP